MFTFSTRDYKYSHDKEPRGKGFWAFSLKGKNEPVYWANEDKAITLTEAKKKAENHYKSQGITHGIIVIEP